MYSTDDVILVREVGKALIMTHDFKRAVKYYETCLQDDPKLVRVNKYLNLNLK